VIDQRVAIVSGAAGGLGGPIAERLAADGFVVAGCDLAPPTACALGVELDVTDAAAVRAFVQRVADELGRPEVLVTAAGVQRTGPSEAVTDEDWRFVLDVNLTGTWNLIRAVLPGMLARSGGRIVTISSEIGLACLAGYAAYATSSSS
jgi:NAD(P)-dependent dehydrogenase (short-subunit alcohol dehydrogenase family)